MSNKKKTGDQMRTRLTLLKARLYTLEREKKQYGSWKRFVIVVNMRIRIKKSQIQRYENRIIRYIDEGRIE